MEWLDTFRSHAVALPNLAKFAIVMAIIAFAPAHAASEFQNSLAS